MNTRILTSTLSILAAVAATSVGTWAYFNSSATNANNVFGAGGLTINIAKPVSGPVFNVSKMKPGQTVSGCIAITNTGDFDQKWRAYLTNGVGDLYPALSVKVTLHPSTGCADQTNDLSDKKYTIAGPADMNIFNGPITSLFGPNDNLVWATNAGPFQPNWAAVYKLEVTMNSDAGSEFQGKSFTSDIKVDATQYENTGW